MQIFTSQVSRLSFSSSYWGNGLRFRLSRALRLQCRGWQFLPCRTSHSWHLVTLTGLSGGPRGAQPILTEGAGSRWLPIPGLVPHLQYDDGKHMCLCYCYFHTILKLCSGCRRCSIKSLFITKSAMIHVNPQLDINKRPHLWTLHHSYGAGQSCISK